jgi:hypothetical protein
LHQKTSEVERRVVSGQLVVLQEAVDRRVLVQPVDKEVVLAPVARVARRDPVEPLEIGLRIARQTVIAEDDRVAADRYR